MATTTLLVLFAIWIYAAGGAVGSFLNVVVYRLPRGLSLVHPGSRCPKCGHAIRPRDNIPVLGWLLLGGRCRDCREPIAIRYPTVELVVATMFLAVAWFEWLSPVSAVEVWGGSVTGAMAGSAATPTEAASAAATTNPHDGLSFAEAGLTVAFHLLLLCTLLAAGLIEFDGLETPWTIALPAAVVGIAASLAWPALRPAVTCGWEDAAAGAFKWFLGLAAGGTIGAFAWRTLGPRCRRTLLLAPALAGLFLGVYMVGIATLAVLVVHEAALRLLGSPDAKRTSDAETPVVDDPALDRLARASPGLVWWAITLAWILGWSLLAGV